MNNETTQIRSLTGNTYRILFQLARGRVCDAFLARREDGAPFVIKLQRADCPVPDDSIGRESSRCRELAGIANIVVSVDEGNHDNRRWIAFPFIEGKHFDEWAKHRSMLEMVSAFEKISSALHAAHMKGIVHRDLKPENILVDEANEPHIIDFGSAKTLTNVAWNTCPDSGTFPVLFSGSLHYASPEHFATPNMAGAESDVYGLGVIMYESLSGVRAFADVDRSIPAHVVARKQRPFLVPCNSCYPVPRPLRTIVARSTAYLRNQRYASAQELCTDLTLYAEGNRINAKSPSPVERCASYCVRKPSTATTLGTTAIAAAIVLMLVTVSFRIAADRAMLRADVAANKMAVMVRGTVRHLVMLADSYSLLGNSGRAFDALQSASDLLPATPPAHKPTLFAMALVRGHLAQALLRNAQVADASKTVAEAERLLLRCGDDFAWRPSPDSPALADELLSCHSLQLALPLDLRQHSIIDIASLINRYVDSVTMPEARNDLLRSLSDALLDSNEPDLALSYRERIIQVATIPDPVPHLLDLCFSVRQAAQVGNLDNAVDIALEIDRVRLSFPLAQFPSDFTCGVTILEVANAVGVSDDDRGRLFAAAQRMFQIHPTDCVDCLFGLTWLYISEAVALGNEDRLDDAQHCLFQALQLKKFPNVVLDPVALLSDSRLSMLTSRPNVKERIARYQSQYSELLQNFIKPPRSKTPILVSRPPGSHSDALPVNLLRSG